MLRLPVPIRGATCTHSDANFPASIVTMTLPEPIGSWLALKASAVIVQEPAASEFWTTVEPVRD